MTLARCGSQGKHTGYFLRSVYTNTSFENCKIGHSFVNWESKVFGDYYEWAMRTCITFEI